MSLAPEKRRPCGAKDTLLIQGIAHPQPPPFKWKKVIYVTNLFVDKYPGQAAQNAHSTSTL